jgi:hypothetical protein
MVIYFTRTFSTAFHMVNAVKHYFNERTISVKIIVSHPDSSSLTLKAADIPLIEPSYESNNNDLFYKEVVKKYNVDLIVPGESSLLHFKSQEEFFTSRGIKLLISGDIGLLNILKSKSATYNYFQTNAISISIPYYKLVNTLDDFIQVCEEIHLLGSIPCFKPDVSQGASGFRIIDNSISYLSLVKGFPSVRAPLEYYLELFNKIKKFPELIVSEYLNGIEVTLDTLSFNYKCLCYLPRFKDNYDRYVKDDPLFKPLIEGFIEKSNIKYLFNIQLRYHNNLPYLLEVNPRFSGGSYLAEKNGFPMLAHSIDLIMNGTTHNYGSIEEMRFKLIEDYLKI